MSLMTWSDDIISNNALVGIVCSGYPNVDQKFQVKVTPETNDCRKKRANEDPQQGFKQLETWCGFYFVPDEVNPSWIKEAGLSNQPIPLVAPLDVLAQVSNAALEKSKVRIHRYGVVRQTFDPQHGKKHHGPENVKRRAISSGHQTIKVSGCDTDGNDNDNDPAAFFHVIELFSDGIEISRDNESPLEGNNETNSIIKPAPDNSAAPLSLKEFQCLEAAETVNQNNFNNASKLSQHRFHVSATVDAISPILPVKGDPFALIELYQPHSNNSQHDDCDDESLRLVLTCVAVMKGDALLRHCFIQPGHRLVMRNVRRQKWHVPSSFEKKKMPTLQNRAPTHVFVISDPCQVEIILQDFPPLYDTVARNKQRSMVVEGTIVRIVRPYPIAAGECKAYYLLDTGDNIHHTALFLQYYPIPQSLACGLRVGTVLRASNVHAVLLWNKVEGYAVCIRSSITILKCASARNSSNVSMYEESAPPVETRYKFSLSGGLFSLQEVIWKQKVKEYMGSEIHSKLKTLYLAMGKKYSDETLFNLLLECTEENHGHHHPPEQKLIDPYAEFFCHTFDTETWSKRHHCIANFVKETWPAVVSLSNVKKICSSHICEKVVRLVKNKLEVKDGGSSDQRIRVKEFQCEAGSIHADYLSAPWVLKQLNIVQSDKPNCDLFCVGFADLSADKDRKVVAIRDTQNRIPLSGSTGISRQMQRCAPSIQHELCNGDLICIKIDSIVVSVVCLGPFSGNRKSVTDGSLVDVFNLQSATEDCQEDQKTSGACSIFNISGYVFLAAIHIRLSGDIVFSSLASQKDGNLRCESQECNRVIPEKKEVLSIIDLLQHKLPSHSPTSSVLPHEATSKIFAVLIRQRFRVMKMQNKFYSGLTLTLGHLPSMEPDATQHDIALSPIQSIDAKVNIELSNRFISVMRSALLTQLRSAAHITATVDDGQIAVATAWWTLADNSNMCALLGGGWDERESRSNATSFKCLHHRVVVELRVTCSNYWELKANASDMACYYISDAQFTETAVSKDYFHMAGGRKFLAGSLARSPCRLTTNKLWIPSELASPPDDRCVPATTIAQLFHLVCEEMKKESLTVVTPSLVQNIRNARLTTLNYCRARAQCTRCFQFLDFKDSHGGINISAESSCGTRIHTDTHARKKNQVSYWNQPRSTDELTKYLANLSSAQPTSDASEVSACSNRTMRGQRIMIDKEAFNYAGAEPTVRLCCPNGCPISQASVFWECSGVIDDGSGQTKLFAERDAAKLLLGRSLDVSKVEEGAWFSKEGIWFNRAVPLSPKMRHALEEALSIKRKLEMEGRNSSRMEKSNVLQFMAPALRAQYILYNHCRESKEPMRRMQFLCRCKPSTGNSSGSTFTRTKVDVVSSVELGFGGRPVVSQVATFSFPTLKLVLVDCCMPISEDKLAWDIIREVSVQQNTAT